MFSCTKELSLLSFTLSLCLSHPSSIERGSRAICRPRSIPKHWGSQRCYFSKLACPPPAEGVRLRFKGRWETSEAPFPSYPPLCRLSPRGQSFEGVITVACITWVTADGGWSQLMKPLKKPPLSWFLLKFWSEAWLPDSSRRSNARTLSRREPAFCLVMGRGCSKSMFEKNVVQFIATLHYRLLFPSKKNRTPLSILVLWLCACKLPLQNESSMFCATRPCPFHKSQWKQEQSSCRLWNRVVLGEGKVKWDRAPWLYNSVGAFAAPGTHLFLQRVPVDLVSCRHMAKLDCGKQHHAETVWKK